MDGSVFLALVLSGGWLAWFVRDRHVKGWRRPLYRSRGYDDVAAKKAQARLDGTAPTGDLGGGGGGALF